MGFALLIINQGFYYEAYAHIGLHLDKDSEQSIKQKTEQQLGSKNFLLNNSSSLELLKIAYFKAPHDANIAARLAKTYIQIAHNEEKPDYYIKAKLVLRPWWHNKYMPTPIRLIRATLLQHEHKYQSASDDLLKVINDTPRNAQAWLTLSAIQIIQGDFQHAKNSCDVLADVSSQWFSRLCHSQIASFTGEAEESLRTQQNLIQQLNDKDSELRLWLISLMAETSMRLGRNAKAEILFKNALKLKPNDHYVLRTYSDFLLSKESYTEVLEILDNQTKNNSLLLRRAIATKKINNSKLQKLWLAILDQRFEKASLTKNHSHDRDESLYQLEFYDDTQKALQLAQSNWQHQKEPDDALMLLLAASKHKSPQGAQAAKDWIKKYKLQDSRLQKYLN